MESNFFDKEKQAKAIEWLEKVWTKNDKSCEVCGTNKWTLADDLVSPVIFNNNQITLGGNIYPHFMITCSKCGNSKTFNAILCGILSKGESSNE